MNVETQLSLSTSSVLQFKKMTTFSSKFPPFLVILCFFTTAVFSDDSAVMIEILNGFSPTPSGWSEKTHFCNWTNINCDPSNTYVTSIKLISQLLSGSLPSNLNSLSQLKILSLQKNSLSGPLPTLSNLTLLQEIYLDSNNFTHIPVDFFFGLTSLKIVSIGDNLDLQPWSIPQSDLIQSASLVTFYASNSNLMGEIPDFFGSFPNLMNLRLSYNNLTGVLPLSFSGTGIQNLWLNNQVIGLSGTIEVLGKMNQLSQVWLHKNLFSGPIPDLSNCTNLFDLQLRDNQFTGVLPVSLTSNLPNLVNITLQNNKLQGPVPVFSNGLKFEPDSTNSFCKATPGPCDSQVTTLLEIAADLGYPLMLAESWIGDDACKGWTFISCDSSGKNVTIVNFAKQKFSGTISPAFANLTALKSLYLNDNNLVGSIPSSLSTLSQLQVLDVSNNNLNGEIPIIPSTVKFTTKGNPLLGSNGGGGGVSPGSDTNATSPSGSSPRSSSSNGSKLFTIIVSIVSVIVFAGVILFVSYKFYYKKHKKVGEMDDLEKSGKNDVKNGTVFRFEGENAVISIEVLRKVTHNFSEDNILGRGGFGVVYKGELHDGTKIAVKRMESSGTGSKGMSEFQAEIAVLTKVRHRHLVALLGYCINGDERLLVYEYMPQGTLSQHLFKKEGDHGYSPLTWKQRVTILLDVARGVEYLHSLARESFIHRDLKPSNILLGDDMRAKVADFGLVKSAPDGKYSMETRIAGTFGYLAPEYAATGRVTRKVDVYAFGVVLMEVITGRKALDETVPSDRSQLVSWFRRVLINKDNLPDAIDQTMNPNDDEETFTSICKVAELAGHCTARDPIQRPDMGHAVNVLGPLVEFWKPACHEEEENYGIDLQLSLPQALERWQADEGSTSTDIFDSRTQTSIPGIQDTLNSTNAR